MVNSHGFYIDKLEPEYKTVFGQISDYVFACNMDQVRSEEILSEVMDSFLSAQSDGKAVEQVTGGDLKNYCEQLCSGGGLKSRILYFFEFLHPLFVFYTALCLFDLLDFLSTRTDGEQIYSLTSIGFLTYRSHGSILAYLLGGAIVILSGYISKAVMKKLIFSEPERYKTISLIIRVLTIAVVLGVFLYLWKDSNTEGTYLWTAMLCCTAFLIIYRIITRKSRQYKKENRISFGELAGISTNISDDIEATEMKRFAQLNKKRQKRGQPEMTFAEFLDKEEKNCYNWDKRPSFYAFVAVAGTLLGAVFTYVVSGFEQPSDLLVFIVVTLTVEGAVMYGLYKLTDAGTKARLEWIRSKKE